MGHNNSRSYYKKLSERLNKFPQGAPPTELLFKILKILFTEKDAEYVSLLPIKPFTSKDAGKLWKKGKIETDKTLNNLADRGILCDVEENGESIYTLPPPMAGFFEFSLMRVRKDIDQKLLSELYYNYLNVEEDFMKELFTEGDTRLGRTFVHEPALSEDQHLQVLDYDRASEVIKTASCIGIGICFCRHKMEHIGKSCNSPMEICMTFNSTAESLTNHGIARKIDKNECLDLLQKAYEHNLVQFGDNVRNNVNFICNCCGCCCEAMLAVKKFGSDNPVHTTNYLPVIDKTSCTGCGKCVDVCPVEAMSLASLNDPKNSKKKVALLIEDACLGCAICKRNCPNGSISLKTREIKIIPPYNSTHKVVKMAIERGKLQNLIFDNQALFSHRFLAAIFGAILKMPPVKQVMASEQIKSRYFEYLIKKKSL